jgi:hypothetical protein
MSNNPYLLGLDILWWEAISQDGTNTHPKSACRLIFDDGAQNRSEILLRWFELILSLILKIAGIIALT